MRRNSGLASQILQLGAFIINMSRKEFTIRDKNIKLTAFEYTILETLMRNNSKVVSKESPIRQLYPGAELRESHTIDVLHGAITKKIMQVWPNDVIVTVRGQGYRFDAEHPNNAI